MWLFCLCQLAPERALISYRAFFVESLSDYMRLKCFVWTCDDSQGLRSIGIALDLLRANACTENFDISFSSEIKIKLVVFSFIIFYFVIASTQRRVNETLRSVEQNFVRCIQKCCLTRTFFPIFVAVFQLHCKSPYR